MRRLPGQVRDAYGDPASWSAEQIERYLDACDGVKDIFDALPKALAFVQGRPDATPAEVSAHLRGGAR
ncbi:hypothetical protein AB0M64_19850 [Streptomyces sp. NPDC051771]|uniref:hypothetical protein n=1 Tax=Streptomyces sp. NPDC051771 TaxID=3154847 RepID=UPI003425AA65